MDLVLLLDAAQDRDGVLDRRLAHQHRLEAPRERRVLLDVLAVLIQRGRADAVQLAARERGLEHVGRVHRALGAAGADQVVQLVDEQDDVARGGGDLGEHRLEPLLELAAVLGAGDQRAEIEREQALVLQALRHVAVHDAQRQALDDRGLADARLADQHRVVLGAAREHLDGAPDLLVAPDHRVELALARRRGQVARVLLQRVVALLGRGAVRPAALAHRLDRRVQRLRRHPRSAQRVGGRRAFGQRQREQDALGRDEQIAGLLGDLLGLLEQLGQLGREIHLAGAGALDLGQLGQLRLDPGARLPGIAAGRGDQLGGLALGVVEQDLQKVLGRQALMAAAQRQRLRVLQKAPRALGIFVRFHGCSDAPLLRRSPVPAPIHLLKLGVHDVIKIAGRLVPRRRRLCRALQHLAGPLADAIAGNANGRRAHSGDQVRRRVAAHRSAILQLLLSRVDHRPGCVPRPSRGAACPLGVLLRLP